MGRRARPLGRLGVAERRRPETGRASHRHGKVARPDVDAVKPGRAAGLLEVVESLHRLDHPRSATSRSGSSSWCSSACRRSRAAVRLRLGGGP